MAQVVTLERGLYEDRLRGMWLAECVANWTGLRTEGRRTQPPFFTDADWGLPINGTGPVITFVLQDPWGADDDTDFEYVYLQELSDARAADPEHPGVLDGPAMAGAWTAHFNSFIWVSNARARELIGQGAIPPSTSLGAVNRDSLAIDAQLTTELFGALAPGMPAEALRMADPFVRVTATGHASHASAFFVLLYCYAPVVDRSLPPTEQARWLVERCRAFLPDSSKASDIVDTVLADFLANPDPEDWERTRDLIYARYHRDAAVNGFIYRSWYESSVNFATGVMALLYGRMDLSRTIQIGTLSGWDSDNPTATVAGALGLVLGEQGVRDALAPAVLSDRYNAWRTRPTMPDHLPGDPAATDTISQMAARMMPLVDAAAARAGAVVRPWGFALPPEPAGADLPRLWPRHDEHARSATRRVRVAGGTALAWASVGPSSPDGATGVASVAAFADGLELADDGAETDLNTHRAYSSQRAPGAVAGAEQRFEVRYDRPVEIASIRLIEGGRFDDALRQGGWFVDGTVVFEVRVDGLWRALDPGWSLSRTPEAARPWEIIEAQLAGPVEVTGIAVRGFGGGADAFVTILELDGLSAARPLAGPGLGRGFDADGDGRVNLDDLYSAHRTPVDWNGDGVADPALDGGADLRLLESALRWGERTDMTAGRR